jgi:putative oxidoreductase
MALGALALRGTIGTFMVGHGAQKLFGSFGGHGLEGTAGFFESLGLRPGKRSAIAAGVAEAGGGTLLLLGALTPLATTAISSTMVTAIRKVHAQNGPWSTNGGYEYNATLIAALTALAYYGPGEPSVDERAFPSLKGTGWALASLAGAVAGSYLATSERLQQGAGDAPWTDQSAAADDLSGDPAASDEPQIASGTSA